jgi:hypothetical protein
MTDDWRPHSLGGVGFGSRGDSGPLSDCFHRVRICASTGGGTSADESRDCLLSQSQPYTPKMSSGLEERWAVPTPLVIFSEGKVCSEALVLPSSCLQPLHVWLPPLPDKTTSAFAYRNCCAPPKSCPSGSELCASLCRTDSLCTWLEFSSFPG